MDLGHKLTDKQLKTLERKIAKVYARANKELQVKLSDYLKKVLEGEAKQRALFEAAEITEKQLADWRMQKIMGGRQWANMIDNLATDYVNADKIALGIAIGGMAGIYALNHNYATYEIEHGLAVDTSYTLYNAEAVSRLLKDRLPEKTINIPKDFRWNKQHITAEITQGILLGESNQKIAKRLQNVGISDKAVAIRNARTMTTGAENAGRLDGYKRAENMGVELQREWLAVHDERTRTTHRLLDGERRGLDEPFSNELMYPGDPSGDPAEFYNCRCRTKAVIKGVNKSLPKSPDIASMSYDEWLISKPKTKAQIKKESKNGK